MVRAATAAISSIRNRLLQEIRRALRHGALTEDGLLPIEGRHLLEEALRGPATVETVLAPASWDGETGGARRIAVPEPVLAQIATTETSPGVIALVNMPAERPLGDFAIILDGVQDPGNAGTLLRSAEAFGASAAVFLEGAVSPWNPKLTRASAGSIFRLALGRRVPAGFTLYAADAHRGVPPASVEWRRPFAIAVGGEAHGLSPAIREQATLVKIPTRRVESLNLAVAASILLYEAAR